MSTDSVEEVAKRAEQDKIKTQSEAQMLRARMNDYIAIALGVGTVFLLWLLQWLGLY